MSKVLRCIIEVPLTGNFMDDQPVIARYVDALEKLCVDLAPVKPSQLLFQLTDIDDGQGEGDHTHRRTRGLPSHPR